jgi:hypothetical protein
VAKKNKASVPASTNPAAAGQPPSQERANALRALKDVLGNRPQEFTPEEWSCIQATLDPDRRTFYCQRQSSWQQYALASRARNCFPGLPSFEAIRAFKRTLELPHVAQFLAEFRAIELLDVMEHRQNIRCAIYTVLAMDRFLRDDKEVRTDRKGSAALAKEVLSAAKTLAELDDLKVKAPGSTSSASLVDPETQIDAVLADLEARRAESEDEE